MRLIDISKYDINSGYISWMELEDNCIERYCEPLISIPTVDAVPITRCKDCKWYDTEYHCKLNGYSCGKSPDWFCADGKREEEEYTSTDTQP